MFIADLLKYRLCGLSLWFQHDSFLFNFVFSCRFCLSAFHSSNSQCPSFLYFKLENQSCLLPTRNPILEETTSRSCVKGAIMESVTDMVFRKMRRINKEMIPTPATMQI